MLRIIRHGRRLRRRRSPRLGLQSLVGALVLLGAVANLRGQASQTWEYSPYAVQIWVAADSAPELTTRLLNDVQHTLVTQSRLAAGATWRVTVQPAPDALRDSIILAPDVLTVDDIGKTVPDLFQADKIMLLGMSHVDSRFVITCRELDCATRTLGPSVRKQADQIELVPYQATAAVLDAFSALVRVEQSRGKSASVRVRAGGLVRYAFCPSYVVERDILSPVIRHNDRDGNPRPGGIQQLDWTYLIVRGPQSATPEPTGTPAENDEQNQAPKAKQPSKPTAPSTDHHVKPEYLFQCEVYSAMRNALAGRSSIRTQRLALKVRPRTDRTRIRLMSREENPRPLEGYQIFAKKPIPKAPDVPNTPVRIGLTDWRGIIDVERDPHVLRIVYVKNGAHLIARLPTVAGLRAEETIELPSDDTRLEAEAFVRGIESMVMDLVARRAILAARIRRRLREGRAADARKLLGDIKSFRTRDQIEAMIASRQKSSFRSSNPREQARIDQMLSGVRILLNKYLDPEQLVALQREVENPGAAAKPPKEPGGTSG